MLMFVNARRRPEPIPGGVELCERYGNMLAAAVEETLRTPLKPVAPGLRTAFEMVDLPYLKVIDRAELKTATTDASAIKSRWAARLLAKLDAGETFAPAYPYPIHAWRLGADTLFIGMGAETVVDYALRFKREYGGGTWVLGYTDDMISYIPSRRVWEEGGYEGRARTCSDTAAPPSAGRAMSRAASRRPSGESSRRSRVENRIR